MNEQQKQLDADPAAAAEAVVDGLLEPDTSHWRRRQLLLAAEGISFDDEETRHILPVLMKFVRDFRDGNDREDQIAACSAIRTYVGLVPAAELDTVGELLQPNHRAVPALDTVLEALKMVHRKLAAHPPATADEHGPLAEQVEAIARAYINPYVLPHGKHAAVAMNAVQALAATGSPRIHAVIEEVNASCPDWFRQQLQRRLVRQGEGFEFSLSP